MAPSPSSSDIRQTQRHIIGMTGFALRQWEEKAGTKRMIGITPDDLARLCNEAVENGTELVAGYAPFCKHLFLENPSPTRCSFAPLTQENRHRLRSGYEARREGELPVLERWLEGVDAPRALFLDVILYSREQLAAEAADYPEEQAIPDADWGIVSIIGVLEPSEPPMPPITQMRNTLGRAEGGSGVPLNRDAYEHAVAFWNRHASIR